MHLPSVEGAAFEAALGPLGIGSLGEADDSRVRSVFEQRGEEVD